ncbi:MAG: glycosyltransferase family 4 protein [Pseudonocardiales bacterium]
MSAACGWAIDARYWRAAIQTGVERYILLLLEALTATSEAPGVAVVIRATEADAFAAQGFPGVRVLSVADRRTTTLNRVLRAFEPSVVHFPFEMPTRLSFPSVFTLHDPGRYLYPQLMVRKVRDVQNERLRRQLHDPNLRAVVTVSHASQADIIGVLGELPCPLVVVPNFVSADFAQRLRKARHDHATAEPFLLAVGVYIPTKNIPRLCRAFRLARTVAPEIVPPRLVLVGRIGWERGFPIRGTADITVSGHVSDDELAALYARCTAFVFPSFYEGFGMPVHEALIAGAPVLCSDIPVLREIAEHLVHFTDPHDDNALAKAIVTRCTEPGPPPQEVDRLLAAYSAAVAGPALLDVYRTAAR